MTINVPGMEIKVTDLSKMNLASTIVDEIMDRIFYEEELKNNVITVHKGEEILEIMLSKNPDNGILKGFSISGKWYCLPDAKDVVTNFIN